MKAGNAQPASRNQKELQFLLNRQKEFKMAALQAKKDGDIENAKDYLRKAKVSAIFNDCHFLHFEN